MQNQEKSPKKGSVDFDRGGTGERGGECETVTVTAKPTEAGLQIRKGFACGRGIVLPKSNMKNKNGYCIPVIT